MITLESIGEGYLSKATIIFIITIFAIIALVFLYKKVKIEKEDIISLSLWSVMLATFFLPHMHDRYLFAADILSIIYFMLNKNKWYIPVGISFVSLSTYASYLWGNMPIDIKYVTILNFSLLLAVTIDIYKKMIAKKQVQ